MALVQRKDVISAPVKPVGNKYSGSVNVKLYIYRISIRRKLLKETKKIRNYNRNNLLFYKLVVNI